jgi:hypothetical protein
VHVKIVTIVSGIGNNSCRYNYIKDLFYQKLNTFKIWTRGGGSGQPPSLKIFSS